MELTEHKVKEIFKSEFTNLFESKKDFFLNLFSDFFYEIIEDKGMLLSLKEIKKEDSCEVDADELESIFNGDFITQE